MNWRTVFPRPAELPEEEVAADSAWAGGTGGAMEDRKWKVESETAAMGARSTGAAMTLARVPDERPETPVQIVRTMEYRPALVERRKGKEVFGGAPGAIEDGKWKIEN